MPTTAGTNDEQQQGTQKLYKTNSISMPSLLEEYVNKLLASPEMKASGITTIHDLSKSCFSAYFENMEKASKIYKAELRQIPVKERLDPPHRNIVISQEITNAINESQNTYAIRNIMWYSHRSHILNALFRSLLKKHVPEYSRMYNTIFDIDIKDLAKPI